MMPESLSPIANHLWQSTLFAGAAGLLTLALRKNSARIRHWVWVIASVKFLVPFALLVALGNRIEWRTAPAIAPDVSVVMGQVAQPFAVTTGSAPLLATHPEAPGRLPILLFGVWACGLAGISISWWIRWRRIRFAVRAGSPVQLDLPIRAISSPSFLEPGVFGAFRPVLLLPNGILDHLSSEQWKSVVAHELCHVRHRDNLIAVVQMFIETVFWFYPLVWWIGKQIFQERERACDEEVLRLGNEPRAYAQGILKVCELYLESPMACVAGVSGSNFRKRIEVIMKNQTQHKLDLARTLLLATAGLVAVAGPLAVGILSASPSDAQSPQTPAHSAAAERPEFAVASIKPAAAKDDSFAYRGLPGGELIAMGVTLKFLIMQAYGIRAFQVLGGPGWIGTDRWDIQAKPEGVQGYLPIAKEAVMVQALLENRFQLKVHHESKEMPVYALVIGKGGPKLTAPANTAVHGGRTPPGAWNLKNVSIADFAKYLSTQLSRTVIDKTDLGGHYDIQLQWTPERGEGGPEALGMPPEPDRPAPVAPSSGPSIFTAIQEQLGLKLESTKGPVEILVVDHAEKPSAN